MKKLLLLIITVVTFFSTLLSSCDKVEKSDIKPRESVLEDLKADFERQSKALYHSHDYLKYPIWDSVQTLQIDNKSWFRLPFYSENKETKATLIIEKNSIGNKFYVRITNTNYNYEGIVEALKKDSTSYGGIEKIVFSRPTEEIIVIGNSRARRMDLPLSCTTSGCHAITLPEVTVVGNGYVPEYVIPPSWWNENYWTGSNVLYSSSTIYGKVDPRSFNFSPINTLVKGAVVRAGLSATTQGPVSVFFNLQVQIPNSQGGSIVNMQNMSALAAEYATKQVLMNPGQLYTPGAQVTVGNQFRSFMQIYLQTTEGCPGCQVVSYPDGSHDIQYLIWR